MTKGDYTLEELHSKNIDFFHREKPEIWDILSSIEETVSTLVTKDGVVTNIHLGEQNLYGQDSRKYCNNQLEDFFKKPNRLIFPNIENCNLSHITRGLLEKVNERFFAMHGPQYAAEEPLTDSGFFFALGLGTGEYVPHILDDVKICHLIIVEPIVEFFWHSCFNLDWEEIFKKADENKISIRLVLSKQPLEAVEEIEDVIQDVGNTFIDGSYYFVHYPSWELQETYQILRERIKTYYNSSGFFEDELVMMRNTYMNLLTVDFRFLKIKKYLHQDYPVVVAASGPSMEFDLENLKKIRDQIILVSSGTTIFYLLNAGLRPDFHAELENVEAVATFLEPQKEKFGFEGISLLASSTVSHKVSKMFDEVYLFPRGAVSSTTVFCKGMGHLNQASPLSANAAVAAIGTLGFRNIYLMGVDCGQYEGAGHHVKGTIYDELGINLVHYDNAFGRKVPGNFGGKVGTTIFMDMSRMMLADVAKRLELNLYNCSHGARIDYAKPLASGAIKLTNPPFQQEHAKKKIRDQLKLYKAGEYLEEVDLQKMVDRIPLFKSKLDQIIDEALKEAEGFADFDRMFAVFWDNNWDELGDLLIMMGGSFGSMIRASSFFGIRMQDERIREDYLKIFLEVYKEQSLWMIDVIEGFIKKMIARDDDLALPENYPLKTEPE